MVWIVQLIALLTLPRRLPLYSLDTGVHADAKFVSVPSA